MSGYKILVVEDEAIAALSLKEILQRFGYTVTALAANKEETYCALEQTVPDLVLMDIHLDEKEEGIEIGKKIFLELYYIRGILCLYCYTAPRI